MKQLGIAAKMFKELVHGDYLYYINIQDVKAKKIDQLLIKSVTPWEQKKDYVTIEYFKSEETITMITDKNLLPSAKIHVDGRGKSMLTATIPPMIYYTSKRALEKWMGI